MNETEPEFLTLQATLAGEYSLQRELGRGGMGVVYLARDVRLDRDVAIKMLPLHLANVPESRERFLREARTAAGLSHPHIVPIHRVGEAGDVVYFVMSYVAGETLGERLRTRGPLSPADATRVMREVAWALAYAHGRGIIHRDIKPDNILLEQGTGRALVTDFGIARGAEQSVHGGDEGKISGTAHFMSPEQASGAHLDGRSDIYALGVVGYLAVSGKLPFDAPTVPALLVPQRAEVAPGVGRIAPGLPRELAAAIDRCLDRVPANRFPDGEALAAALAPAPNVRPALPPMLRAWLAARNPLVLPYLAFSGAMSVLTAGNIYGNVIHNPGSDISDVIILATFAVLPLFPLVGFHLNQARRQFRAGHTLADLRSALDVAKRERAESENAIESADAKQVSHKTLQMATIAAASSLGAVFLLMLQGVIHENRTNILWFLVPLFSTMVLGAVSNALDVQFIPKSVRNLWQNGIRDRLWNSQLGEWFAKKLKAPERSAAVDGGVFRPTEAVVSLAAADLFRALPPAYKSGLHELPQLLVALEAHAAEARAELDVVAALAPSGSTDAAALEKRRLSANTHLADSVAALERIRIDLLRLHAGANDLSPLTTLIDAAHNILDDIGRLADAEREVEVTLQTRRLASNN